MSSPGLRSGFVYDLFCVIVHEGTLNTGHYWSFCKWQDQVSATDRSAPRARKTHADP